MENNKLLPIETEIKDKYLRKFKEDIVQQQQIKANERQNKILEEREILYRVQKQIEEEKMRKQLYKMQNINDQLNQYNTHLEKKKLEEQKKLENKLMERNLTSLNMNSEQRLNQFKTYIGKLDENVEKNMEYHKQYLQANSKFNSNHSDPIQKEEDNINKLYLQSSNGVDSERNENKIEIQSIQNSNIPNSNNDRTPINYDIASNNNKDIRYNMAYQNSYDQDINKKFQSNEGNYIDNNTLITSQKDQKIINAIPSQEFLNKNNKNYQEYYNVKRDYLNYNKNLVENKMKITDNLKEEKKRITEERMKELEKNYYLENELKRSHIEQQKIYKTMLDGQKKDKFTPQIINEKPVPQEEHFYHYKNSSVPVAPYSEKKYDLGGTILDHNPILNPVPYYKNNKYLFREGLVNNSLRFVGNNIIG